MESRNKRTETSHVEKDMRIDIDKAIEAKKDVNENVKHVEKDMKIEIDRSIETKKDVTGDIKNMNSLELDSFVKKLHYPAKKQEIIDTANKDGSSDNVTSVLRMIAEKYYSSADELAREIEIVS